MLHISAYWLSEEKCTRSAAPHRTAYFRLLVFRRALQKISSSASGCIFPLTGLPKCIAEDWQLRTALHIFAYWASAVHCTRLAAPHRAAYFLLLAFRSALHKISSALHKMSRSALSCIPPLTGHSQCIAQNYQIRIELYGYPDIRKSEYPETRICRYPEIRISAEPDIQVFGNPNIRKPEYPNIRKSDFSKTWISRYAEIRISEISYIQISENPHIRKPEYPDIRTKNSDPA